MRPRVVVIGAGLAGIAAALTASRNGAHVVVVDRTGIGLGSNSAMANAAFHIPGEDSSLSTFVEEALAAGRGVNRRWMLETAVREAPGAFAFMAEAGLLLEPHSGVHLFRSDRTDVVRGAQMMRTLAQAVSREGRIQVVTGFHATEILHHDGCAVGAAGWGSDAVYRRLSADALILATGGCGALYRRSDNQKRTFGQGYALALRAGLSLRDMEFVQFYPLVMADARLPSLMLYPPHPPESRLINERGENLAVKAGLGDLNRAIRMDRDRLSAFLYQEGREGNVAMDYTQVPDATWNAYPLAMLKRMRFDFRHRPVPVSPGAHFCMGGVDIDRDAQTSLSGLYACGEVVGGMHGANRRGGNALTECVVFGHLAGKGAAKFAVQTAPHRRIATASAPPLPASGTGKKRRYRDWSRRLQTIAWRRAGVVRSRVQLKKGATELEGWKKELEENPPATAAEARMHDLLSGGALVLDAVLTASLEREESRGAFLREDFPFTDDVNWRKNSRICLDRASQRLLLAFVPAE